MTTRAFIGLGSNLGEPPAIVSEAGRAVLELGREGRMSSLYRTEPQGGPPQPAYCNAVAVIETAWTAVKLLDLLQRIEARFGRVRRERWGPRTLDLDLLLFGHEIISTRHLVVPHPRLAERRFVLEPLLELDPDLVLPDGTRLSLVAQAVQDQEVTLW